MNYLLAVLSALLLVLVFPRFNLVWLAPVALTPLLFALAREANWKRWFLLGWVAGTVYWASVCYWIQYVLEVHGGMGAFGSRGAFALFAVLKGLHMALFASLAALVLPRWWALPAIAALWTGIERTHGTFGFAWLTLGNAGAGMEVLLRLAPLVGTYGLSFCFALMNGAFALLLLRRSRHELVWLLLLPFLYLLPPLPEAVRPARSAATVQPSVDGEEEWTAAREKDFQQRMAHLSLAAALQPGAPPPDLIVWPEVPAPLYFFADAGLRDMMTRIARTARTHLLFGVVAYTPEGAPLNSAVLLNPDGQFVDRYDKMYLVPFGEFVPPVFGFVNRITREAGDFVPGARLVVFPLAGHRAGVFICYESVFPHLVRRFAGQGAEVFLNLSNDGYFGRSAAREQHLTIVRMRAVENRSWVLRATNNGITASIDPAGRVVDALPSYATTAARLGFDYIRDTTPYTRNGDWFAWGCLALGLGAAAVAAGRRGSRSGSSSI